MRKLLTAAAILVATTLSGCVSEDEATNALSGAGYTNITTTGYRFAGCGQNDLFHTGFEATGPTGQRVSGVVCSGLFKGATIRFD